jgi:membrane protein implicated in regulation of membrane protease activity
MHVWFWAWVIVAATTAVVAALTRDRHAAPWAGGATIAALLEAGGVGPAWQWAAFLLVSVSVFVAVNRARYVGRHARDRTERATPGRHAARGGGGTRQ